MKMSQICTFFPRKYSNCLGKNFLTSFRLVALSRSMCSFLNVKMSLKKLEPNIRFEKTLKARKGDIMSSRNTIAYDMPWMYLMSGR